MTPNIAAIPQVLETLKFNENGLIPAIAQQYDTGEVLMMAWMNAAALEQTLRSGQVCYWSRSRQKLWHKGETSGQHQILKELRWDCDADTLLLQIDQEGVACHTGRRNCFYFAVRDGQVLETTEPEVDPRALYGP